MNTRHITLRFALLACIAATAMPASAQEAGVPELKAKLTQRMPGARVGDIRPLQASGLYEVVINGRNVVYTDAQGSIVIRGEAFELPSGKNLTKARVDQLHTVDFASLPLDKAIMNVKGNGSRRVAVFADPDCPHCKQLERELSAITDVTIYTFLLPLPSIHPDAPRKAAAVWCAPDRAKAWDDIMLTGREPAKGKDCDTPLREIAQLADRLQINGTPGLIFGNGTLVPGGIPRAQIERLLNQ